VDIKFGTVRKYDHLHLIIELGFFNSLSGGWIPTGSTRHGGHWLAYWLWWWRIWWNEDWQGKPKYSEKTRPRATLSTTNPTWPNPGSNPSLRGGKPATNRLSYGAALELGLLSQRTEIWGKKPEYVRGLQCLTTRFVSCPTSDVTKVASVRSEWWDNLTSPSSCCQLSIL
jgi:hypothetical protein